MQRGRVRGTAARSLRSTNRSTSPERSVCHIHVAHKCAPTSHRIAAPVRRNRRRSQTGGSLLRVGRQNLHPLALASPCSELRIWPENGFSTPRRSGGVRLQIQTRHEHYE